MEKQQGIYQIRNTVNGKVYIGSSVDILKRWGRHRRELRKGIHTNPHLQSSWDKHMEENFIFEKIEDVLRNEDLLIREQWFFDNSLKWDFDYNMNRVANKPPSPLGRVPSAETRKKISDAQMGEKNHHWGRTMSDSARNKISISLIGNKRNLRKKRTPEQNEIQSEKNMGKKMPKSASPYIGVYWDSTRRKWGSRITVSRKAKFIGRFENEILAAQNHDIMSIFYYGEKYTLNFTEFVSTYKELIRQGLTNITEEIKVEEINK